MPGFIKRILGRDPASKIKNIQYLGNIRSADGIAALIRYLGNENVEIRRAASSSLEQHWLTGNRDAIVALTKALNDPDAEVRKNSALALGEFISKSAASGECEAAKGALIRLLGREGDEDVIKCVVVGLAHIQDNALIGPMAEGFSAKDKKTVAMAIDAINDMLPTRTRLEMKRALRSKL